MNQPTTIAIVDDDPHAVAFAEAVLAEEGYRVAVAAAVTSGWGGARIGA